MPSTSHLAAALALANLACQPGQPKSMSICAGNATNCDRPYDQVTFAGTHDAYAYATGGPVQYTFPNQDLPISSQLAYGIRALDIRPSPYGGSDPTQKDVVYVTHNYGQFGGSLGEEPFVDVLTELRTFLDANPTEVVTLVSQSYGSVTQAQVAAAFQQAGLEKDLHSHDLSKGWPTLREMAATGERVIVFHDSDDPDRPPWMLKLADFTVVTDYNITNANQFTCLTPDQAKGKLYIISQSIYRDWGQLEGNQVLTADPLIAQQANQPDFAYERALGCWRETKHVPNFINVDFFAQGDIMAAVNRLNALPRE